MIRLKCPGCGVGLKVPETFAGKKTPCPKCRRAIQIPNMEEPEPVEEEELLQKADDEEEVEEVLDAEEAEDEEAPARPRAKKTRARKPAEEEDEDEDEEEEDRPRRKKRRGGRARGPSFFTRNRISGIVGVVWGGLILLGAAGHGIGGGAFGAGHLIGLLFGVVLLVAGVSYLLNP
jgi:hypothetical protein